MTGYVWPNETIDNVVRTMQVHIVAKEVLELGHDGLRSQIVKETADKLTDAMRVYAVEISQLDLHGEWAEGTVTPDGQFQPLPDDTPEPELTHEAFILKWHPIGRPVRLVGGIPDGQTITVTADPTVPGTVEVSCYEVLDDVDPSNPFPKPRTGPVKIERYRRKGWNEPGRHWVFEVVNDE